MLTCAIYEVFLYIVGTCCSLYITKT